MGLILDVVPNHMSISSANAWWLDVLETGPSSPFAGYFDIDWHSVRPDLENKVLLPILEDQYGKVLESGKLRLVYEDGAFSIHYYDTKLPVAPRTYSRILEKAMEKLDQVLERQHEHFQELLSILTALSYLPPRTENLVKGLKKGFARTDHEEANCRSVWELFQCTVGHRRNRLRRLTALPESRTVSTYWMH